MAGEAGRLFEVLKVPDAYRVLKIICGGNEALAKACGVSYHWVDRWGGENESGSRNVIQEKHWKAITKQSRGLIDEAALRTLSRRT